jgi:hypothetical protein
MFARFTRKYGPALLVAVASLFDPQWASAQINCSVVNCLAAKQTSTFGYSMFTDANFNPIFDAFGRRRRFLVHIPDDYDNLFLGQKVPLVFAFHGADQTPEAMINGKWGGYFDHEVAFVIPQGEPDPCDNLFGTGKSQWLLPGLGKGTSPGNVNCDPATATQFVDPDGDPIAYWNASLQGTFTDVLFVEALRSMVLSRFADLNANKVYATGFSSGGGLTLALACYRSSLFRGFSIVARMLAGDSARGDYDGDGVVETDSNSLVATCGKSVWDAGHATGIAAPNIWGYGVARLVLVDPFDPFGPFFRPEYARVAKPVALFAGDQDIHFSLLDMIATRGEIRARNNLASGFVVQDPFLDTAADDATTERRTFTTAADAGQASAPYRGFWVRGTAGVSAIHAIPDAQECTPPLNTCDWNYTAQTIKFFQDYAGLSLVP